MVASSSGQEEGTVQIGDLGETELMCIDGQIINRITRLCTCRDRQGTGLIECHQAHGLWRIVVVLNEGDEGQNIVNAAGQEGRVITE